MVAVAELEAGMISARVKAALAAAKARGVRLGGFRGASPTTFMRERSAEALRKRSQERAADLSPAIASALAAGATSLELLPV